MRDGRGWPQAFCLYESNELLPHPLKRSLDPLDTTPSKKKSRPIIPCGAARLLNMSLTGRPGYFAQPSHNIAKVCYLCL